jgi:4-amino-4-deoxy-L-arabinose transferase-like glycosyltransferase
VEPDNSVDGANAPSDKLWPLWLVFFVASAMSLVAMTWWAPTYDEPNHLAMGQQILSNWDFSRLDNSKMPVSMFNAMGWRFGDLLGTSERWCWWWARLPQIGWLLGSAWIVFIWVRENHGYWSALCAAALVAFDPNLQAHSTLVTTDAPCTFFVVLCAYLWSKTLSAPSKRSAAITGVALGLAQAVKFTSIFLVPILAIMTIFWSLKKRRLPPLFLVPILAISALISLNSAYSWQGTFTQADTIEWRSDSFASMSDVALPLPVPRPWIEGLDWVKSDDDMGHGNIYLNGEMTNKGRNDYFLLAMLRKFPIPLLLLGLAGLASRRREGLDTIGLTVAPLFLLCWFSFAFNFQLGLRYILPVIPFFAMFAARLPWGIVGTGAGLVLFSNLTYWPWGISYMNEATPRHDAWRYLADSNLDWGQGEYQVNLWKRYNHDGIVNPQVPTPGPTVVSANALTGVLGDPARLACLRDHFAPTSGHAHHLYMYNLSVQDFTACFEEVFVEGHADGDYPPGDHLVVMKFRGNGELTIGDLTQSGESSGELLLGAVVHATDHFDIDLTHEGWDLELYIDGIKQ